LTPRERVAHPKVAVRFVHRLSAVVLAIALFVGHVGLCPGWAATPEARMACCENGTCPMRDRSHTDGSDSERTLTQAQADSCCASSEREDSTRPDLGSIVAITHAVLGNGVLIPASTPALVLSDHWRTVTPLPTTPVARHVLLSVFLV
jgi:hypothetical protein